MKYGVYSDITKPVFSSVSSLSLAYFQNFPTNYFPVYPNLICIATSLLAVFLSSTSMSIIFILVLLSAIPCGASSCPEYTGLRFGQTIEDFIQLSAGIMDNSTTRFSLCTWIKKRFTGSEMPMVLDNNFNIILGDNGYYNYAAGTHLRLRSKYNRTLGTWFHICLTWSGEESRTRVYLDGHLIGTSGVTERSELERGRSMCLGNRAPVYKYGKYVFGGDLFKLNIYNRVLTEEEIKNMAADMCSCEEEKLASIKVLSWEDVLTNERSGNITEIPIRCRGNVIGDQRDIEGLNKVSTMSSATNQQPVINSNEINKTILAELESIKQKLDDSKNKTIKLEEVFFKVTERLNRSEDILSESKRTNKELEKGQSDVLKRLENTEQELAESKNKLGRLEKELDRSRNKTTHLEDKLAEVEGRLDDTEEELAGARNKTAHLEGKLTEVEGRLDDTEEELAGARNKTTHLEEKLAEVEGRLDDTEEELAGARNKAAHLEGKLTEVEGRLNDTEGELAGSRNKAMSIEKKLITVMGRQKEMERRQGESNIMTP